MWSFTSLQLAYCLLLILSLLTRGNLSLTYKAEDKQGYYTLLPANHSKKATQVLPTGSFTMHPEMSRSDILNV